MTGDASSAAQRSARQRASAAITALVVAFALASCASDPPVLAEGEELIDLRPDELASFGLKNVGALVGTAFMGYRHFYKERTIRIDTTPSGGMVDLFYVRSNFQKRFEQAETPVTVIIPARVEAGPRDSVTIRAFAEGFRQETVRVKVASSTPEVVIDLDPLPNTLDALSHRYFAGRSTIAFLTGEVPNFRLQEASDGFSVVLNETALAKEARAALDDLRDPLIDEAFGQQLGEDLLVKVSLSDSAQGSSEVRSRQQYNAARDLHEFVLEVLPEDGGRAAVDAALASLAAVQAADVTGCALRFDAEMRGELDPGALNRALAPQGDFTDRYVRAAMRRLGEVTPGGAVQFSDGSAFRPSVPIELEVSLSQAASAVGFLALLRTFVFDVEAPEYQRETYRSLIAPELDAASFDVAIDRAEAAERSCLASS